MAAAVSPSSSPRLPSPPPIAEDQIGPTSPGISLFEDHGALPGINSIDTGASRRIRPGTRAEDMAEGPPLVELHEIDSAFQLTEHLKALHYARTHPRDSNEIRPISQELARELVQPPPNTSREIWLYELGRFLIQKTNAIIVALFADDPPCSPQTCPEMRASEWQYLCAVHDPPKSCSAIDYCCHTLDWAANSLTSSKMFPSRLGLGTGNMGGGNDKFLQQQMKEITNIFRRVYRIYAHTWFQHREMFWKIEGKTGLYIFFKTVCDEWNLIQQENYTIPPEAEGGEPKELVNLDQDRPRPTSILPRPGDSSQEKAVDQEPAGNIVQSLGNTTKRHTRGNSNLTGSVHTVIQEEAEEEEDGDEKKSPSLGRSGTILYRTEETALPEPPAAVPEEEEDDPSPGVTRSDTLKPEKEAEESDEGETTVITVDGAEIQTKPDEPGVEVKIESVEPVEAAEPVEPGEPVESVEPTELVSVERVEPTELVPESAAADGEEATKSVGD